MFMEDLPEEEQDTTGLSKYGAGEPASHAAELNPAHHPKLT